MKVRAGFVSNSSTSSFVIAFGDIPKCDKCGKNGFEFIGHLPTILTRLGYVQRAEDEKNGKKVVRNRNTEICGCFNGEPCDLLEYIEDDIKDLNESKEFLKEKIRRLSGISVDDTSLKAAGEILSIVAMAERKPRFIEKAKDKAEYQRRFDDNPKVFFELEVNDAKNDLKEIENEIKKRQEMVGKVSAIDKSWKIMTVELDISDSFIQIVKDMEKSGHAVILEKATS